MRHDRRTAEGRYQVHGGGERIDIARILHPLTVQIRAAHLVEQRDRVIFRHQRHRDLVIERNGVQARAVDRQPDEAHIDLPLFQGAALTGLRHRNQFERCVRETLRPDSRPLGDRDARNVTDAQPRGGFAHAASVWHARRTGVDGGGRHTARPLRTVEMKRTTQPLPDLVRPDQIGYALTTLSPAPMASGGPGIDRPLFTTITDFAEHTRWLNDAMLWWTDIGLVAFAVLMVVGWWLARRRDDRSMALALLAPVSVVIAYLVAQVVKEIVAEPRPCRGVPNAYIIEECPVAGDYSFPSGHTTTAAATVAALFLLNRRLGWIAAVFAVVEAFSRVYVGGHYPHDVVAAAILAVPVALAVSLLLVRPATALVGRIRTSPLAPLVAATGQVSAPRT